MAGDAPQESYSIWMEPKGAVAAMLSQELHAQARERGAPAFEPHVTLLGLINMPREEALRIAEQLASQLRVGVGWGPWLR